MQSEPTRVCPTGTAYGRPKQTHDATLSEVGPGTPCGEFMRRYWHPVGFSTEATATPKAVRLLGEDLILFRDRKGRPGLLYPRCMHRGTTLFYGRVEDEGIRCCYHGWLFDVEGRCLDQPCEAEGGRHKDKVRQPWYPVAEQYGLVWAYLGPPDRMPLLPKYDIFEELAPDEVLEAFDTGLGTGGNGEGLTPPCNWLQHWENIVDPFHVLVLHCSFSGNQFVPEMAVMPKLRWEYADCGVAVISDRALEDGRTLHRVTHTRFPTLRLVPQPRLRPGPLDLIGWTIPIDDTHYKILNVRKVHERDRDKPILGSTFGGKRWSELTEEEHQRLPGDYEAQVGQGPITLHSEDHLVGSDQGVAMLRRALRREIEAVSEGRDPAGTIFDPAQQIVRVEAGNYFSSL